jgi:large subunit ribosomal protein L30
MAAKVRVTLVKSVVSHTARTRATVRALGLHRIGDSVEVADTPEMRGMTRAVRFLLKTDAVADQPATAKVAKAAPEPEAAAEEPKEPSKPARSRSTKKTEEAPQ